MRYTVKITGDSCDYYVADKSNTDSLAFTLKTNEAKSFADKEAARKFGIDLAHLDLITGHMWQVVPVQPEQQPATGLSEAEVLGYHDNQPVYYLKGELFTMRPSECGMYVCRTPFTGASILSLNKISDNQVYFNSMYNVAYCSTACRDNNSFNSSDVRVITKEELKDIWCCQSRACCTQCNKELYNYANDMINLRELAWLCYSDINKLPIAFTGTFGQCKEYAARCGYEWEKDNSVFGGYYLNKPTGKCLLLTK